MYGGNLKTPVLRLEIDCFLQEAPNSYFSLLYFNSSVEARNLADRYRSQWPGDETHPVRVTGDMEQYLTSKAKDVGLGDFNRKDLIAATFKKKNDKGNLVLIFLEYSLM